MKIAIIGAQGRLGSAFVRLLSPNHQVTPITRQQLDLTKLDAITRFALQTDADWVINCAAISGIEACFDNPLLAHQVNALAPERLAAELHRRRIAMLHLSTDYVLDGRHPGLKPEDAKCKPINIYGESKWEGEFRCLDTHPDAWVCRISWIFGPDGDSFPQKILNHALKGEHIEAIADKFSLPTYADDFVHAWEHLAHQRPPGGIYHLCNSGQPTSWHQIAQQTLLIAQQLNLPIKTHQITPTQLKHAHFFRDPRPQHTTMSCQKIESHLGSRIRPWQAALQAFLPLLPICRS